MRPNRHRRSLQLEPDVRLLGRVLDRNREEGVRAGAGDGHLEHARPVGGVDGVQLPLDAALAALDDVLAVDAVNGRLPVDRDADNDIGKDGVFLEKLVLYVHIKLAIVNGIRPAVD